mmetsp:Transcript_25436/g.77196  ORF Transcript_25436/g.77196 Transcript_25436/m.77196 type:complete len:263 (+) Transcript_25436:1702-2490(+)|eukprot:scaffold284025_cov28-Tisochrysis_lutea.AAC.1
MLVRQRNLDLHLEPARSEKRCVDHVEAVGHADDEDVVERVHTINFRQQLVDHRVADSRVTALHATLLADRVDLVKDDYVQVRVVAPGLVLRLGLGEKLAHVLLGLSHEFGEDLRPVDHLGLLSIEHLANLACDQRLTGARRPMQHHALHVRDAQLLHSRDGEDARSKSATEDVAEFLVEPADAHCLERPVRAEDVGFAGQLRRGARQLDRRAVGWPKLHLCLRGKHAARGADGGVRVQCDQLERFHPQLKVLALPLGDEDLL